MISYLQTFAFILVAYLIGSIPFGYLTAKWLGGIDIRMVGSGNIGATNVGRVMGFRYFCLVFAFDFAKGLLPTLGFPLLFQRLTGQPSAPELAVFVALATILGHNFPVYLKFKGGKGVATSLGAMLALDPVAGGASALGFLTFLVVTRYVSLSSLLGGLVFFLVHFLRVDSPWDRGHRAMSVMIVGLLVLLFGRHRKNLARIGAGTEPKVSFRRKKKAPEGRIAVSGLISLTLVFGALCGGYLLWRSATRRDALNVGQYTLSEVARAATGHQRTERVAFFDGGWALAVTCPRYNRLVLYRVLKNDELELFRDLELDGKPMAVCPAEDRLFVLERPPGDNRHVEPGWWQAYGFDGEKRGDRVIVGFYPDDMALSVDGRHAFVLNSGKAEGGSNRPVPALDVFAIGAGAVPSKSVGRLLFEGPKDDPARLTLSVTGRCAAVTLVGSNEAATIDLFDPMNPRLTARSPLAEEDQPYPTRAEDDWIVMPAASGREAMALSFSGMGECVASTLPHGSGLEVFQTAGHKSLGSLRLRTGIFGLSSCRPTGMAFSTERGLIAVANRAGGVHLIAIRPQPPGLASRSDLLPGEKD